MDTGSVGAAIYPQQEKFYKYVLSNPIIFLIVFGAFLVVFSAVGAKSLTIPIIKLTLVFDTDILMERILRIASFIIGLICVSVGVYLSL